MGKKKMKPTGQKRYSSDDIIFSILYRLPVKSVVRFTCVSKSWNDFIRSPRFSSTHYNHLQTVDNNNNNSENSCSHLIYLSNDCWRSRQDCTLSTPDAAYNLPQLPLNGGYTIIGVCEGLISLLKESTIYIWNPLGRNLKQVPADFRGRPVSQNNILLGFGFARQSDDYRVIQIIRKFDPELNDEVTIYSLAEGKWRKVENCGSIRWIYWKSPPLFFKGCIYWMSEQKNVILRFDVEEERFEEMVAEPLLERAGLQQGHKWSKVVMFALVVASGFLAFLILKLEKGMINVSPFIYKESGWIATQSVAIPNDKYKKVHTVTQTGQIILLARDHRMFAYQCYYDDNSNLFGFKFRDLKIYRASEQFDVIPITERILFLPESN